jgi:hypothetical protein
MATPRRNTNSLHGAPPTSGQSQVPRSARVVPDSIQTDGDGNNDDATMQEEETPLYPSQTTNGNAVQQDLNSTVVKDFVGRVAKAASLGELLRCVPAPAQATTKPVLEEVLASFIKQSGVLTLVREWKDKLNKLEFSSISALNSIRPPVVQICKEAKKHDNGELSALNLSEVIADAKDAALVKMIAIKEKEAVVLGGVCSLNAIVTALKTVWAEVAATPFCTPETLSILIQNDSASRVAQAISAIGKNAVLRVHFSKTKQTEARQAADQEMTDVTTEVGQKKLQTLIGEALKRREQAQRDKKRSGKDERRAGPPKKKNQEKRKVPNAVRKNKKQGTSAKRQPKKP